MDCLTMLIKGFKHIFSQGISVYVDSSIRKHALASLVNLLHRSLRNLLDAKSPQENGLFLDFGICAGCNTEIRRRHFVSFMREFWHSECFLCRACNQPTNDYEFSNAVRSPYHKSCYGDHLHAPICQVCEQIIPWDKHCVASLWNQDVCYSHVLDGTPCCYSCQRLEIKEFYANLDMKIEKQIPIALVDKQILKEEDEEGLDDLKGLCCMSEDEDEDEDAEDEDEEEEEEEEEEEPYKPPNQRRVDKILILRGLPRLETGCILAHEMMHAWFWINGYQKLREEVEEGMCLVLEHMWLESELKAAPGSMAASTVSCWSSWPSLEKYSRSQLEWKLGSAAKDRIEKDTSSVYGDGFRAGHRAVSRYGLKNTLYHIRRTGSFPR